MNEFILFPIIIAFLIINFLIAFSFGRIAEAKGHDKDSYSLVCFFLPLIGWLMVIALPNKIQHAELLNALHGTQATGTMPALPSDELPKL